MAIDYRQVRISYRAVAHRVHRCLNETQSVKVEDHSRHGSSITIVTQNRIDAVQEVVNVDPHISIDGLVYISGISYGSVDTILKQHFSLKNISSRRVPHKLICLT
jgi:hypothetical protein